ncbi:Uncharacterised protein [Helicobacter mustelae]|nr:Uncharacterised protein [Helicobacter mustelae]
MLPETKNFGLAGREAKASLPFFMYEFFPPYFLKYIWVCFAPCFQDFTQLGMIFSRTVTLQKEDFLA